MNTIHMPGKYLTAWLEALRSGKYIQAKGRLERGGGYCCLGVLEMAVCGRVERRHGSDAPEALPTLGWLKNYGISFTDYMGSGLLRSPPVEVTISNARYWVGLDALNDEDNFSFQQIADAIEEHAQVTDGEA